MARVVAGIVCSTGKKNNNNYSSRLGQAGWFAGRLTLTTVYDYGFFFYGYSTETSKVLT